MMKTKLFCLLALSTLSSVTMAASSSANWTASFLLNKEHGITASHTPYRVCFGPICSGTSVNISFDLKINGLSFSNLSETYLELNVNDSKQEFIDYLRSAGFDPIEQ